MRFELFYTENGKVSCFYLLEQSIPKANGLPAKFTLYEVFIVPIDIQLVTNSKPLIIWVSREEFIRIDYRTSIKKSGFEVIDSFKDFILKDNNVVYYFVNIQNNDEPKSRELVRDRLFTDWLNHLEFKENLIIVEKTKEMSGYTWIYKGFFRKNIDDAEMIKSYLELFFKGELGIE